jgi:hypothetical protein
MKRVVVCSALAGLACAASAQNISTDLVVSLTFDDFSYFTGETGTATIMASWNGVAGSYFSSISIDLISSTQGIQVTSVAPIAWNNPVFGFTGSPSSIEGGNIIGLQAAQFSLIPPFTSVNPILVTTFEFVVTGTLFEALSYSAQVTAGAPYPFSVTGPVFSDPVVEFGLDAFQGGSVVWIPAPGAAGLLGCAGLTGLRRRR